MEKFKLLLCVITLIIFTSCNIEEKREHPFIWATQKEKPVILDKISKNEWAKVFFETLRERSLKSIKEYNTDKFAYLNKFAFNWENVNNEGYPSFHYMPLKDKKKSSEAQDFFVKNMQIITDCAVLYYLTDDEQYAQVSLDISYSVIRALNNTKWNEEYTGNGGWIYPKDNLRELRYVSVLPVVYDFIYPYIKAGAKAYDLMTKSMVEPDLEEYQRVFLTYARSAVEHGHSGSNWSVLESPCLVQCALAMEDMSLRKKYLEYYLTKSVPTQESLVTVAERFKNEGDVWPETSSYSSYVADYTTYLLFLLTKYDPDLHLGRKYVNIPAALPKWNDLVFPDGKLPLFGDGTRTPVALPRMEIAYSLAEMENLDTLKTKIGGLIAGAIDRKEYNRPVITEEYRLQVDPYFTPALLLWGIGNVSENGDDVVLPRTDVMPHAELYLQRNLSPNGNYKDGLMAVVMGAPHVHSHAGGMNIELYGKGTVLGCDAGPGEYTTDIHENYYRLYAAHNCVISNGCSSSSGGWVGLGTSTVKMESMEPLPREKAISENYSYTTTSFVDKDKQNVNALHERSIVLVRTSSSTGYYVDVYRAKSDKKEQFHDYLYHNLSDEVNISGGLNFKPTPERYMANAKKVWKQNGQYRHPGWHFFENVRTSKLDNEVIQGIFRAKELGSEWLNMRFFVAGNEKEEFTIVDAPKMKRAPKKYANKLTPTFVIRKNGEAWDRPFAVVYEPTEGKTDNGSVTSVEEIVVDGKFKGLMIESKIGNDNIKQYVIIQDKNETFENNHFKFKGHIAVVTYRNNILSDIYSGNGSQLEINGKTIKSLDNKFTDFYIESSNDKLTVLSYNSKIEIK